MEKEVLHGCVTLSLPVLEADGVLEKGVKVRITDDREVGIITAANQVVFGYILVPNREAAGNATIVTRGKRVNEEEAGGSFSAGDLLNVAADGRVIRASSGVASGTLTVVDFTWSGGETITINGTVLTEGVDFNDGTSNAATALSIANAINSRVAGVHATAAAAVVTVRSIVPGVAGNAVTLATNAVVGDLTLSGATLTGGSEFFPMGQALEASAGAGNDVDVLWF